MKFSTKLLSSVFLMAVLAFTFASCNKNDTKPNPRTQKYQVTAFGNLDVKGTAMFKEVIDADSVIVTLKLQGKDMSATSSLPVKIRKGTSLEKGEALVDLGSYDGSQMEMVKEVNLSFDQLKKENISLSVYKSDNSTIVAQAELGANATFKSYDMKDDKGEINGQFRVYKRDSGSYLVIKLVQDKINEVCQGNDHPVSVVDADGFEDADFALDSVSHEDGISANLLTNYSYKDIQNYGGGIKVYCSKEHDKKVISEGKFK